MFVVMLGFVCQPLALIINIYFSQICTVVLLYGRTTERKTNVLGLKLLQAINYRYARMSPGKAKGFEQKPFVKRFNEHFS